MNKIRIAMLGCGSIAKKHVQAIKGFEKDLEIVAVCDANNTSLQQAMQEYAIDGYTKLEDLLHQAQCDVVTICTPSGLHAAQTMQIARAGKHIICEKPMATRWADGLAMVKACDEAQVKLFIVKQNRFNPTIQLLKQAIDKKRFGQIYMITCNVFWTRPQDYYSQSRWRGTFEMDGGALMNQASHYVDLLYYLFGPVASVQAMTATLARDIESEDSAVLNLRWRRGALGSMNVTMLTYPKNLEASLTVLGENGTVKVGGNAINDIQHWQFADSQPEDQQIKEASEKTTKAIGIGHSAYYENVIQTLRGQASAVTDGREGLKSLEILIAAYRSARDDQTVALPLEL